MRRRFGRRRWRGREGGESGAPRVPVDASALARLAASSLAGVSHLEPLHSDDVPDWLCALGLGEAADGKKVLVVFSPTSGIAAILGAIAVGSRLAAEPGFRGRVIAVAPAWREVDRRALGLVTALPFELTALAVPAVVDEGVVEPESQPCVLGAPAELAGAGLATPAERARFERVLAGLRGLAAKHGGVVRGGDGVAELVLLSRPVASLRAGREGTVLDVIEPARASYRLAGEDLAEILDRLEGQIRKFMSDRQIRDGEDGLRGRAWEALAEAAGARSVRAWPVGEECEAADFTGVDLEGTPIVGAVRRRLGLDALAGVLEAALRLEPIFGSLLAQAPPPIRLGAPGLALAGVDIATSVDLVLRHLGVGARTFSLREMPGGVELALHEVGAAPASAPVSTRPARQPVPASAPAPVPRPFVPAPAGDGERQEDGVPADLTGAGAGERTAEPAFGEAGGRRRRRRRGRRGGREGGDDETPGARARELPPERAARPLEERSEAPPAPRPFLEMSLFDLDDENAESEEPRGRRGRRRGRRRAPSGEAGEAPASDDESEPEERAAQSATAESADDDADADAMLELSPDAPELEEPEPQYEEGDLEEAPLSASERLRMERERRRHAQVAATPATLSADEAGAAAGSGPIELGPELPRGRAAILAHADRRSILGAILLARETRSVEGLWIYPQSELMTFFRGVGMDLRANTPIYVVGFEAKPSHDVLQAAALYRGRLAWFDHRSWPPEDLHAMRQAIGPNLLHVTPGTESVLPAVLALCGRQSRFTDKLVDLLNGSFTQHDWLHWGRLWWHRLGELGKRPGDHRADLEPLLAGRPSDLTREASRVAAPPIPAEAEYAASEDFRLVYFGGYGLVVSDVPAELDAALVARILRERFGAVLSLARSAGSESLVLGADETGGRVLDVAAMVDHLAEKLEWVDALPGGDHVARLRIRDLARYPERVDEVVAEIGMSRSILDG